jgi:hypothetical protein
MPELAQVCLEISSLVSNHFQLASTTRPGAPPVILYTQLDTLEFGDYRSRERPSRSAAARRSIPTGARLPLIVAWQESFTVVRVTYRAGSLSHSTRKP